MRHSCGELWTSPNPTPPLHEGDASQPADGGSWMWPWQGITWKEEVEHPPSHTRLRPAAVGPRGGAARGPGLRAGSVRMANK